MKRARNILLLFLLLVPLQIKAATYLNASNQNPVVGTNFDVTLFIDYGADAKISSAHYLIGYDTECFSVQNIIWSQTKGTYQNENGQLYLDKASSTKAWEMGIPVTITFHANKTCRSTISLSTNGDATYENGSKVVQTTSGVTIEAIKGDTDTQLGSITIEGYDLYPTFQKSITSYTLTVPASTEQLDIKTTKGNANQTITGDGVKKLNYGPNRIRINVTSQSGATNTYEIMVTRLDDRTGATELKALSVSNTNITYSKNKYVYDATVSRSVTNVFITARASSDNATLTGTGNKELAIGLNTFIIKVKSDTGSEQEYTINITRSTDELQAETESTNLLSLTLNNQNISLNKKNVYLFIVDKNTNEVAVNCVTESKTATTKIAGNTNLKAGFNIITITVTEKNNDSREYKVIVYKEPAKAQQITSITASSLTDMPFLYKTSEDDLKISQEEVNTLIKSKKTLYYNVTNTEGGLLYQLRLTPNLKAGDISLQINQTNSSPLTYQTNLPSGIEVLLYLDTDMYKDGTNVHIYTYNEEGQYTILTEGSTINDGYISFITNGEKNYVITTQSLIKEESFFNKLINKIKMILVIGIILVIIIVVVVKIINKKISKKYENEPLY